MALTCDRCLAGQPERCRRDGCAQWLERRKWQQRVSKDRTAKKRARKPSAPRPYKPTGNPRGAPWGARISESARNQAAAMLLVGYKVPAIAKACGITTEQVRTVKRNLQQLNGVDTRRRRETT